MTDSSRNNRRLAEKFIRLLDPSFRQRWEIYDSILKRLTGPVARWLDGGCGRNVAIEEFPCDITVGIDRYRHPEALHQAPTHLVLGTLENLPFRDSAFTLVTLNTVAEHLENPRTACGEIRRVLEPCGHLLIHTTNRFSPLILLGKLIPDSLRLWFMRIGFGAQDHDVFRTFHRMNTRKAFRSLEGFEPVEFHAVQDLNWSNLMIFFCLLAFDVLTRLPGLWRLRTNFVVLLRKKE